MTLAANQIPAASTAHTCPSNGDGLSIGWILFITLVCLIVFILLMRFAYWLGLLDGRKDGNGEGRASYQARGGS